MIANQAPDKATPDMRNSPIITTHDDHPVILIVDDDPESRGRLKLLLKRLPETDSPSTEIECCTSIPEALNVLYRCRVHVVLLDKELSRDKKDPNHSGIEAIPKLLHQQPHLQIVMVTGSKDVQDSVRAIQLGALGYVSKDLADDLILSQIQRAIDISRIAIQKFRDDRSRTAEPLSLGGKSRAFKQVLATAQLLAETNRPVLLLGETGTGKSEIARYIHECRSAMIKQSQRNLFSINVAALAPEIVDRELFGHEKGAYTDASESRLGYFEAAGNSGTLFLDEIGEASQGLQAKLLTVIETGEFCRVGGVKKITARPKLIFATNRNLEEMVEKKAFREDLYMRISSFPLRLPSLSERVEDIPDIIRALLKKCCTENNVFIEFPELPHDFIEYLAKSSFLGNIRGIQHQMERLLVLSPRDSKGKPILKNWRGIPGLYLKPGDNPLAAGKKGRLTLQDVVNKPFDMLGPNFPGLLPFLDLVRDKLVAEAQEKFSSNIELAKALRLTSSYTSRLRRGIQGIRYQPNSKKKKRSPK